MKCFMKCLALASAAGLLSLASATAQTVSGSVSGSGNASVAPGQAGANASANQSVQAPGASANANANASAQAQTSNQQKAKQEPKNGSGKASGSSASGGGSAASALNSGTNVQAELTKPLDCKKVKPGDEVEAKVTQDVKSDGKVVIHKGSRLVGHVTQAQARTQGQANSSLGIAFDKAVLKGGQEVAFSSVIQAIAPPVQAMTSATADENAALGAAPAPGMSGGGRAAGGGGGLVGGVSSAAGGAVSGATGTVGGAVNTGVSGATRAAGGLTAQGNLTSASQGAIGLQGLALSTPTAVTGSAQGAAQGSVITSASRNVHLESGTQMMLRVTGSAQ